MYPRYMTDISERFLQRPIVLACTGERRGDVSISYETDMPGAMPETSTRALANVALPYV